jgi:hypothetical protein
VALHSACMDHFFDGKIAQMASAVCTVSAAGLAAWFGVRDSVVRLRVSVEAAKSKYARLYNAQD